MAHPNNRGRTRRSGLLIAGISVLVLVGVAATLLAVVGWSKLSSVFAKDREQQESHAGKVAVVVSPVGLPAFTALDPAVFINRKTGDVSVVWVTEKVAQDNGLIRDPGPFRGRVLRRDKNPGLAFTEADFYPAGTLPSPTAAIEEGYRGIWLPAKDLDGLEKFKRFDRVDLFGVIPVRISGSGVDGDVVYTPETAAAMQSAKEWKTERRILAQNARIIVPAAMEQGPKNPGDCFVAIRDEEVSAVTDALAKKAKIVCMARSGLPGGDMSTFVDDPAYGTKEQDTIQVLSGSKSWKVSVPAAKDGEAPAEPR